uniref:Uncharacterized protein n=1 Tax=Prymnesium polylepis TaxID=72548 RepID=A0A7S4I764_9EUKA
MDLSRSSYCAAGRDDTVLEAISSSTKWWAALSCGHLQIHGVDALSPFRLDMRVATGCHRELARMALGDSSLFVWLSCAPSTHDEDAAVAVVSNANMTSNTTANETTAVNMTDNATSAANSSSPSQDEPLYVATLHLVPLDGRDDPVAFRFAEFAIQLDACIDCLASSKDVVALGRSDGSCEHGGAVTLWHYNGTGWAEAATVTSPELAASMEQSNYCGFGRVVRTQASLLFVGAPDAYNGSGAVAVYDISDPRIPLQLCQWVAPPDARHFGGSIALRPSADGEPQLVAIGMDGLAYAAVHQVVRDASGAWACEEAPVIEARTAPNSSTQVLTPSPMVFASSSLITARDRVDGVRVILVTSFCCPGQALMSAHESWLPFGCTRCEAGRRSLGGRRHECIDCEGLQCAAANQSMFNITLNASGLGIVTGDQFKVQAQGFTSAVSAGASVILSSQQVLVDLTPPNAGAVNDVQSCNTTTIVDGVVAIDPDRCNSSVIERSTDVDSVLPSDHVQVMTP